MDIDKRIEELNKTLEDLRFKWKTGTPMLRLHLEERAKTIKSEIRMLEKVLQKRRYEK